MDSISATANELYLKEKRIGIALLFLSGIGCYTNSDLVLNKLDDISAKVSGIRSEMSHISKQVSDTRSEMSHIETKVVDKIDLTELSLKSLIKEITKQQVREAMEEILQGGSVEELVRNQVYSELRRFRHGQHQMKRQLHHVMMVLNDVQLEKKTTKVTEERNISANCAINSEVLQKVLGQCQQQTNQSDEENEELIQNMISLNNISECESTIGSPTSQLSTITTTTTTIPSTTTKPEAERGRIIVAPYASRSQQQFLQITLDSNTLYSYPYLNLETVYSLTYVSKLKKLLLSLFNPMRIISSNLNYHDVKTVREGVFSYGMAIDEERELIFMTTHIPRHTISRMSIQGKHFTAVSNLLDYTHPFAIAVNPEEEMIYACTDDKLFKVTYEGRYLQTIARGSGIRALTLDNTGGILFYNDDTKLAKFSLSQNVSSEVTDLSIKQRNLIYHDDTLYFSEFGSSGIIGAVNMKYDVVSYTLKKVNMVREHGLLICLVP